MSLPHLRPNSNRGITRGAAVVVCGTGLVRVGVRGFNSKVCVCVVTAKLNVHCQILCSSSYCEQQACYRGCVMRRCMHACNLHCSNPTERFIANGPTDVSVWPRQKFCSLVWSVRPLPAMLHERLCMAAHAAHSTCSVYLQTSSHYRGARRSARAGYAAIAARQARRGCLACSRVKLPACH